MCDARMRCFRVPTEHGMCLRRIWTKCSVNYKFEHHNFSFFNTFSRNISLPLKRIKIRTFFFLFSLFFLLSGFLSVFFSHK